MRALEELLQRWRKNPDASQTLALCSHLGGTTQENLIREVGTAAETWHRQDLGVMLAVGRMYLESGLFAEAQAALVAAGKVDPNAAPPYRFLGEVLLRRGDAARAEKVLARAIALGKDDSETRLWHERASLYLGLQKRVGPEAVADEVNRTIARSNSIPAPAMPVSVDDEQEVSTTRGADALEQALRARGLSSRPPAAEAAVQPKRPQVKVGASPIAGNPAGGMRTGTLLGLPRPPSQPPPAPARNSNLPPVPKPPDALGRPSSRPPQARVAAPTPAVPRAAPVPRFAAAAVEEPEEIEPEADSELPTSPMAAPSDFAASFARPPLPQSAPSALDQAPAAPSPFVGSPSGVAAQAPASPFVAAVAADSSLPAAEAILEQLARAGVYDPQETAYQPWEAPKARRPRGLRLLIALLVIVVLGGVGAHQYQSMVRQRELAEARKLEGEVKTLLDEGTPQSLEASVSKLGRVFELDSTSKRAAVLWLHNRALAALVLDQEPRGIEGAMQRLDTLGAQPADLAVGRLGSALIEGDLGRAASAMTKLDPVAGDDAMYQLLAGVVLDRAGEANALKRYRIAIELEPELRLAHVLAAQLALLQGGETAKPVLDAALAKLGDSPAAKALRALAWATGPREGPLPADATVSDEEASALPRLLRAVPVATQALTLLASGKRSEAIEQLQRAIGAAGSPQVSSWLGFLALELGDVNLAREAALRAMRFSAVYSGARILAARVAVANARLDEAVKAIEGLDPGDPEVAVVHAAVAYEALDLVTLEDMGAKLKASERSSFAALIATPPVVLGRKYPKIEELTAWANPAVVHGPLIALDALLDKGDLDAAQQIVQALGEEVSAAALLRKARLLRYQGKASDAVTTIDLALKQGALTQRALIEAVYDLLEADNSESASDLVTRYAAVLGGSAEWLKVLIDVGSNPRRAKTLAATLQPPSNAAPVLLRVLGARTLAAAGDRRAKAEVATLLRTLGNNPDVVLAAKTVGLRR